MNTAPAPTGTRSLLFSSSIGTIIEWYDFFVFASAAALFFNRVFFPRFDARTGILLSLMTYAMGFITRPLGGVVFGVLGDRYGRKRALLWSLGLMGVATVCVGLVPGYAVIGVAAPALLVGLRLIQGLAVGGEVGGALLLVAESLPASRRGYYTAWPMIGGAAGNLLSSGALALLGFFLTESALADWGWRVAFLASGALIGVGVWIRRSVDESPLYLAYMARRKNQTRAAFLPTLLAQWRSMLTVLLVKCGENALFYVFTTFFVVYVTQVLRRPRTLALEAAAVASITEIIVIFAAGALSDKIGRIPVTAAGLFASAVWVLVLFPAAASGGTSAIMLAAAIGGVCHGVIVGGMSAFFVELFPTSTRYTGFSIGYQMAAVFSGAITPLVGMELLRVYGTTLPISLYAAAMTGPALVCLGISPETRGRDLSADD
jgi:MFS family permease